MLFEVGRAGAHDAVERRQLARREHWTRYQEWASWRAKGLVKPLLGPLYSPTADWVLSHVTPGSRRPTGLRSQACR